MGLFGKVLGGVGGFITGGPGGAIAGLAGGGRRRRRRQSVGNGAVFSPAIMPGTPAWQALLQSEATDAHARADIPCRTPGLIRQQDGSCRPATGFGLPGGIRAHPGAILPGGAPFLTFGAPGPATDFGQAVMGRYGAALVPGSRLVDTAVCPRGTVLGDDGLCYNRRDIRNSDRMWPRGRRPLLTGGEMSAIAKAARAANRLKSTQKRLEKIGLLKKPTRRAPPKPRASSSKGITVIDTE